MYDKSKQQLNIRKSHEFQEFLGVERRWSRPLLRWLTGIPPPCSQSLTDAIRATHRGHRLLSPDRVITPTEMVGPVIYF